MLPVCIPFESSRLLGRGWPSAPTAVNTHTAAGFQSVLVRRSDMAFVIFSSASQAAAALKRMSGTKVSGGGGSVDSR